MTADDFEESLKALRPRDYIGLAAQLARQV